MKNRKKMVSLLAGIMAAVMVLTLVLSLLPTRAYAASSSEIRKQINQLKDPNSTCCALAERAFVRTLDGGCTSPVAAYAQLMGDDIEITGLYVSPDETVLRRGTTRGPKEQAEALGRGLALELKGECP